MLERSTTDLPNSTFLGFKFRIEFFLFIYALPKDVSVFLKYLVKMEYVSNVFKKYVHLNNERGKNEVRVINVLCVNQNYFAIADAFLITRFLILITALPRYPISLMWTTETRKILQKVFRSALKANLISPISSRSGLFPTLICVNWKGQNQIFFKFYAPTR